MLQQLEIDFSQKQRETINMQREFEDRRMIERRQEEEAKYKLQDQILSLEDALERIKYDRTFSQNDNDARIKAKDMQLLQQKDEIEALEGFLVDTFRRF